MINYPAGKKIDASALNKRPRAVSNERKKTEKKVARLFVQRVTGVRNYRLALLNTLHRAATIILFFSLLLVGMRVLMTRVVQKFGQVGV